MGSNSSGSTKCFGDFFPCPPWPRLGSGPEDAVGLEMRRGHPRPRESAVVSPGFERIRKMETEMDSRSGGFRKSHGVEPVFFVGNRRSRDDLDGGTPFHSEIID
jgi:hypothetical protein